MTLGQKIRSFLTSFNSKKNAEKKLREERDTSNGDPYSALSEVAAPKPVDQADHTKLPSLEERLSYAGNENQDEYEPLSEVAGPDPVSRDSDEETNGKSTLEQSLH